jgi:ketosteroid isomerase-like protein
MKNTLKLLVFSLALFTISCKNEGTQRAGKEALRQADLDFSEYSVEHGMTAAFLAFADSTAVLLRPGMKPVKGIQSVGGLLSETDDSRFNLSWEPTGADISRSGDLGYTYGIYTISDGQNISKGTYVTIWKKDNKGHWKFVLDTGNAGLGEGD